MRIADLFCGGGGLSQGFENAGFSVVVAYDWWDAALNFYNKNHPHCFAKKTDLSNVDIISSQLKKLCIDAIIGGPPCQDFSSAGKRDENGARANLTISFANIIKSVLPSFFVMENVARAATTKTFARAIKIFRESGYGLTTAILDASLCGVPQKRKRVFVVGFLNRADDVLWGIFQAKQRSFPMTVREYLGEKLDIEYYYRHPRSYARRAIFSVDEPSPTIRGVNRPVPSGYHGHPGDAVPVFKGLRSLTTRERAMIQTFPENWILDGNKSDLEQIIGNAVPVKLGEFVASSILEYFTASNSVAGKGYPPMLVKTGFVLHEQQSQYDSHY